MGGTEVPQRHAGQVKEIGEARLLFWKPSIRPYARVRNLGKRESWISKKLQFWYAKRCSTVTSWYIFPCRISYWSSSRFVTLFIWPQICVLELESVFTIPWNSFHSFHLSSSFPSLVSVCTLALRISHYSACCWLHNEPLHCEPWGVLPVHEWTAADTSSETSCRTKGWEPWECWVGVKTWQPGPDTSCVGLRAKWKCGAPYLHGRKQAYSFLLGVFLDMSRQFLLFSVVFLWAGDSHH